MSDNDSELVLCVEETLASGKRVVFAHRRDGGPICCWDAASLPSSWLHDASWHLARVAVGTWDTQNDQSASPPTLLSHTEAELAAWLAKTYRYLNPLLGNHACTLSSFRLFRRPTVDTLGRLNDSASVLEVGGSEGVGAICGTLGCRGWAVDPAFADSCSRQPGRVLRQSGTAESLPFPDASFDAVICLFVLEHLINPRVALREMGRVLTADGTMLIGIPVARNPVGVPPFLHRWRFVFGGPAAVERTLPLTEITDDAFDLTPFGQDAWRPLVQEKDACLFKLRKACHG